MSRALISALALALLPSALAFQDTSPLFLFSTANLYMNVHTQVAQSDRITLQVLDALDGCPSKTYILVRQDGVSSVDYINRSTAPRLASCMAKEQANIKSTLTVSEVAGKFDSDQVSTYLQTTCGAEVLEVGTTSNRKAGAIGSAPQVIEVSLPAPPGSEPARAGVLQTHDKLLEDILYNFAPSMNYTVIYTTTPQGAEQNPSSHNEQVYSMEDPFGVATQMELKRDTSFSPRAANETTQRGGLFERYQYFSPGLFMAFTAMIPLVLILGVALKAIASLEVSYFAFSKEMGPAHQKKQ